VTPPLAATCNDNPVGRLCSLIKDRGFPASDVVGYVVQDLLQGLFVFLIVVAVGRFLRRVTLRALTRATVDAQLRTLINNVFLITTLVVAILAGATAGGLDIKVLLTFGGLASLALGLAFQDLLRNILAGIFLLIERPFRIGDWITAGDLSGSVQTIQLRTTALRTADGRLAILPNTTAFNNAVVNSTAYDMRQFSVAVRLPPGSDLAGALAKTRGVVEGTEGVLRQPGPFVQPRLDADGGVTLLCRYWVQYRDHDPDALAAALVGRLYDALGPWAPPAVVASPVPPGIAAADAPGAGETPPARG
jgi:small conductance mechanosensitive channel